MKTLNPMGLGAGVQHSEGSRLWLTLDRVGFGGYDR